MLPASNFSDKSVFPEVVEWKAAAQDGDWETLERLLLALPDSSARYYACRCIGEVAQVEDLLTRVSSNPKTGTLPHVLLAGRNIEIGWKVRSGDWARNVSAQRFAVLHHHLRLAERALIDVTAREPDNATAWALRLITARGLEVGQSEARRRYDRLRVHDPHFYPAQSQFLQQLCPKWSGSWEAVFAFADECSSAPVGSASHIIVAEAHVERWAGGADGETHLRRTRVIAELVAAAEKSVRHSAFPRESYYWYSGHGAFAMLFSQIGDYQQAAVHFRAMGSHPPLWPWTYLNDSTNEFKRHRTQALGRG